MPSLRRLLLAVVLPVIAALLWQVREPLVFFLRTMHKLQSVQAVKDAPVAVTSSLEMINNPWPDPSPEHANQNEQE